MKRIVIVPARSGSKRIPNKNIKNFCGRPIITYPLEILKKSSLFDEIHVSTNSHDIYRLAQSIGLEPRFMRPENLSDDYTGLMDVLKYVIRRYDESFNLRFDQVWLIMPCSPFLEGKYLLDANQLAVLHKDDCIISMSEYPVPIEWAFRMLDDGQLNPSDASSLSTRSQDLEKSYYDNGMLAVFPGRHFYSRGKTDQINYRGLIMSKDSNVDIDNIDDWQLAELLFSAKHKINYS